MIRNEEWSTMRRLLFMRGAAGGALKEYEVEGNPAIFQTNVAKPLSGFTIPFVPKQAGSGDPSPQNQRPISGRTGLTVWRTGKNLYDKSITPINGYFNSDGLIQSSGNSRIVVIPCSPNTEYVITKTLTSRFRIADYGTQNPEIGDTVFNYSSNDTYTTVTHTTAANAKSIVLWVYNSNFDTMPVSDVLDSIQVEVGDTPSSYAPYTGQSYPVTFPALGKNLLNPANSNSLYYGQSNDYTLTDGVLVSIEGGSVLMGFKVKCKPNTKYTFTFTTTNDINMRVYGYPEEPETYTIGNQLVNLNDHDEGTFMTGESDEWLICGIYIARDKPVTTVSNFQLEVGETATAYEPFDNTVYGGTVYPLDGRMLVEWKLFDLGALSWSYADTSNYRLWYAPNAEMDADSTDLLCEQYKPSTDNTSDNTIRKYKTGGGAKRVSVHDDRYNEYTVEQFTEAMSGVYYAAKLATPIEIPLSDIPVPVTLKGDNTIWTDTNGSNTIKYKKKG